MPQTNNDRVTIGLYSIQKGNDFNPTVLKEINNILAIKTKFTAAAKKSGRMAPEIVISVLLIPDWKNKSSYNNTSYKKAEKSFIRAMRAALNKAGLSDVILENFYDQATDWEKAYLEELEAKGSNADMIKTHAIIDKRNRERRHLQMDSNTQIHDYEGMYNTTFGADVQAPLLIGLNASYYDTSYVSGHNKVVYTPPGSTFPDTLEETHFKYCQSHKDDHTKDALRQEKIEKNSIYSKDFVVALEAIHLVKRVEIPKDSALPRIIYPASMKKQKEYRLTKYIVTAVHSSWKYTETTLLKSILKNMLPVKVGDAFCDFESFSTTVKKYTGILNMHNYQPGISDDKEAHDDLLAISDTTVDKIIIRRFYDHAVAFIEKMNCPEDEKKALLTILAKEIPDSERGNDLTQELFQCSVKTLHEKPQFQTTHYITEEMTRLKREKKALDSLAQRQLSNLEKHTIKVKHAKLDEELSRLESLLDNHSGTGMTRSELHEKQAHYQTIAEGKTTALPTQKEEAKIICSKMRHQLNQLKESSKLNRQDVPSKGSIVKPKPHS